MVMKPPRIRISIRELRVNGLPPREIERFRAELERAVTDQGRRAKPGDLASRLAHDAASQIKAKLPPRESGS
jgi:hypothetical protein